MEDCLIVPRDVLQRAYDVLEELPDWHVVGTETWTLYHQMGNILYHDPAFITPIPRMEST